MFDELYNKAKKTLISEKEGTAPPKKEQGEEKPIEKTKDVVLPIAAPKPTTAPVTNPTAVVTTNAMSHKEQELLLKKRKQIPGWVLFLKYLSLFLIITGIAGVIWLTADLDKGNKYLSLFNATENTGSKNDRLQKVKKKLDQENLEYSSKISRINQQLETKNYSVFTKNIQDIRDLQLVWFDTIDEGDNLVYGILEGPRRAANYFNSKTFDNPILSSTGNNVQVGDVSANKQNISFSVDGSHLFGKAFFLNTEFIALMNAFPIYEGGFIDNFSKKRDENGNQSMSFSLKLSLQDKDSKDLADENFIKYENWLKPINNK